MPGDHEEVRRTFRDLDNRQRAALIRYLNADGIKEKPGFILCDTPAFLASARNNREVGLLPATKILLRVYESADKEFHGTSAAVITIQLGTPCACFAGQIRAWPRGRLAIVPSLAPPLRSTRIAA